MATPEASRKLPLLRPLERKKNFQAQKWRHLFFSDVHILGAPSHFLATCWFPKSPYCCLVDHGDQDQSPTPPSEQQETPENPMVSRTIGSSRKQQSGETTPLTQYRSGRVSPDKSRNISAKLKKTTIEKS